MGEKLLKILVGALLLFVVTNLAFPEFFQGTILAAIAPGHGRVEPHQLYYLIESGEERQLADSLHAGLASRLIGLDVRTQLLPEAAAPKAEKLVLLREFNPEKPDPGSRVVKLSLLPTDKDGYFPLCLEFYRVDDDKRIHEEAQATIVNLVPGANADETTQKVARLLALAY